MLNNPETLLGLILAIISGVLLLAGMVALSWVVLDRIREGRERSRAGGAPNLRRAVLR
jgi:hypothetical protein